MDRSNDTPLTHLDPRGGVRMVDVGNKDVTERQAVARGRVKMKPETLDLIAHGGVAKGDVLALAQVAGIMAAKKTPDLIPLCHPLDLSSVTVRLILDEESSSVEVEAQVRVLSRTGAEMEALTAVAAACLTVYDMCKAVEKGMEVSDIRLVQKSGGKSGHYVREDEQIG
ncbi:MAG: cyclic pyranopterin monophosphate synthase MoaC [Bacillota bacterium]